VESRPHAPPCRWPDRCETSGSTPERRSCTSFLVRENEIGKQEHHRQEERPQTPPATNQRLFSRSRALSFGGDRRVFLLTHSISRGKNRRYLPITKRESGRPEASIHHWTTIGLLIASAGAIGASRTAPTNAPINQFASRPRPPGAKQRQITDLIRDIIQTDGQHQRRCFVASTDNRKTARRPRQTKSSLQNSRQMLAGQRFVE